ncbi:MAG: hypothetical protein JNK58_14190 [Phycisphaerae bacterium]|nr:hypothetical protein [Phycisphaerae bacterium]
MSRHPLENDLLDLIEGRLAPPDRVESVRAALSGDRALLRRVEQMVADRRGLIELEKATLQAARADRGAAIELVREAIERSERDALIGLEGRPRKRRLPAIAAAIGVVAAAGLLAGGTTWIVLEQNAANRAAEQHKIERSSQAHMSNLADPVRSTSAPAGEAGVSGDTAGASAGEPLEPPIAAMPTWINTNPDPHAKEAVRSWAAQVEKTLAEPVDSNASLVEAGERALRRVESGGSGRLSIDEAAGLVLTRQLKFVVSASGLDWGRRRAEVLASAMRSRAGAEASADASDESFRRGELEIEVTAALDPEHAALRDALSDLQRRFGGPTGESGWFELDPAADGPAALPSLGLNDILWWSSGPSAWRPGVSVRVRVQPIEP